MANDIKIRQGGTGNTVMTVELYKKNLYNVQKFSLPMSDGTRWDSVVFLKGMKIDEKRK